MNDGRNAGLHAGYFIYSMRKSYVSPAIEVLEVLVEQGYSGSDGEKNGGGLGLPEWGII